MDRSAQISKVQRLLRYPWYWFWRTVEKRLFAGRNYIILAPWGHRVFTPWFGTAEDPDFRRAYGVAVEAGPMAVTPDRCYLLHHFCRAALLRPGAVAECGVFQGGTAHLLSQTVQDFGDGERALHLFDTFQGMPPDTNPKRDYHAPGAFSATSLDYVRRRLAAFDFTVFHPGRVPDTFVDLDLQACFCFVHLDMDIYEATLQACRWFWPRMVPGGIIILDDYGFYPYRFAARAAADEFFANRAETPIALPTGQGLVIKT